MAKRTAVLTVALGVGVVSWAFAHDMFLKTELFFAKENSEVPAIVVNGTFVKSSNSISRNRLADVSVISPAGRERVDTSRWGAAGDTSHVTFKTGAPGTYVLAMSTKPSEIEMEAKDFNGYLKEDGIPEELARRARTRELGADTKERYSKHVKAIIQVGDARTSHFATTLGYPAEIVPIDNPYSIPIGGRMRVKLVVDGKPFPNSLLLFGGTTQKGEPIPEQRTRADGAGIARVRLTTPGVWYLKFISMARLPTNPDGVTHESKWATLTFAIR